METYNPFAGAGLAGVDPGGDHLDQDLARPGNRSFNLHDLENVEIAELIKTHSQRHLWLPSQAPIGQESVRASSRPHLWTLGHQ
jgi:hypothetical protein